MFSRETLIALRARRTAYRVAIDFLFPHLLGAGATVDYAADDQADRSIWRRHREPQEIHEFRRRLILTFWVAGLIALIVVLIILAQGG